MNLKTVLLLLLLSSFPLLAQNKTSTVLGLVKDASGKPAANVRVYLSISFAGDPASLSGPPARNLFHSLTSTDADGAFYFSDTPAGRYLVAAEKDSGWTYFPNAGDIATATPVFVNSLPTSNVGTLTLLAPGNSGASPLRNQPDLNSLKKVPVRIEVEGGLSQSADPFEVFFAGDNNQTVTVRFDPRLGRRLPPTLELGGNRSPRSIYARMPSPSDFSGVFEVPVWAGEFSVLPTGHPDKNGLYIKTLSMGNTDLRKQRLKVEDSMKDPVVVTLAHCTATTPECN
jgi:hypothetical protein